MRVKAGVVGSGVLLAVVALGVGCRHSPNKTGIAGPPYDQSYLSCKGAKPNRVCEIKLKDIISHGHKCVFNQGELAPPVGTDGHKKFAVSVRNGEMLKVLPDPSAGHNKARFRGFILLTQNLGCPATPFGSGQRLNGFGEDLTGAPAPRFPAGCVYELAVQSDHPVKADDDHPIDPQDGMRHFCVDPHFEMIDVN